MSWRRVRLGELLDNFSVRAKNVGGAENLEFYGVSNELGIIKTKYAAEEKAEDYKVIEKDCFAYNPYRINVGSIGLVDDDIRGLISPAYVVFKPKPNSIKPLLLLKFLKSSEGLRQIRFHARGTVRQALRFEDLCNIEIELPDYDEQELLITRVTSIENKSNSVLIELKEQNNLVKQLRQAFLTEALQGKLTEQNKSDGTASELLAKIRQEKQAQKGKLLNPIKKADCPFEIPENWEWCRLGDLSLSSEAGRSFKCEETPVTAFHEWGVIKLSAVSWDKFLEDENKRYSIGKPDDTTAQIKVGDFIISRANTSELVGKSVIVKTISKNLLLSDKTIRYKFSEMISPDFVNLCNNSRYARQYYAAAGAGTSPSMKNITREQINNLLIPLPPSAEQERIVNRLDELMNYCDKILDSILECKEQTDRLVQQILRETLRVKALPTLENKINSKQKIKAFYIDEDQILQTLNMTIIEILQTKKTPIRANVVWNSSEYKDDIEQFYAELKTLIEVKKIVIEEKIDNISYLKLATNEN